jgi:hypothetical protein
MGETLSAVRRAVRAQAGVVTAGDVMARTGLGDIAAEAALKSLLVLHPATLDVKGDGTLLYRFETTSLARRWTERAADAVRRFVGGTLLTVAKVAIMLTVVGYSVVFVLAATALAIAAAIASEGDILDGDALGLIAMPFRLIGEMLFWVPEWLFWGTSRQGSTRKPRSQRRGRSTKGPPVYERIFRYLFGPPSPRLREEQLMQQHATRIRELRGVVTEADWVALTGEDRDSALHTLARLVGRFGGDVAVTEDGTVIYLFADLVRGSAAAIEDDAGSSSAPRRHASATASPPASYEGQRPLTGNTTGTNAAIAGMGTLTLIGGLGGAAIFERIGVVGTLPLMLGAWLPVAVGVTFLALPLLRWPALASGNDRRAERDVRRAMLDLHRTRTTTRTIEEWTRLVAGMLPDRIDTPSIERVVRDMAAEFGADGDEADGQLRYAFPSLVADRTTGAAERKHRRLNRPAAGGTVWSTAEPD